MPSTSFANHLFASIDRARSIDQLLHDPIASLLTPSYLTGSIATTASIVMTASKGAWKSIVSVGKPSVSVASIPMTALSDCLDSRKPQLSGAWVLLPIPSTNAPDLIACLAFDAPTGLPENFLKGQEFDAIREHYCLLGQAIDSWYRQQKNSREVIRLNQILQVAANWHTHQDLDRLLQDMAQAATRLLRCDRASIFLWDKPARELVGHPALGMEGKP